MILIKIQFIKSISIRRQRMSQIQLNIEICKWKWSGNAEAYLSFTPNGFLHFSSYSRFSEEYFRCGSRFHIMHESTLAKGFEWIESFAQYGILFQSIKEHTNYENHAPKQACVSGNSKMFVCVCSTFFFLLFCHLFVHRMNFTFTLFHTYFLWIYFGRIEIYMENCVCDKR